MTHERKTITDLYVRICQDGGFEYDWADAAKLAGKVLQISALEVYFAVGSLSTMQAIADGTHPAAQKKETA